MRLWGLVLGICSLYAQERTWTFRPARDTYAPEAILDLRYLNEDFAGQRGFIRANRTGEFLDGAGGVIRFWGVNSTVGREQPYVVRPLWRRDEPSLETHAKFLAKRGVNLVRLKAYLNPDPRSSKTQLTDVNTKERDWIWRAVAAYRKEGIYTVISPYGAEQMRFHERWGIAGGEQDAHGLLFFDERLQAAYKAWLRALYDPVNPHTGRRLADEPAVAVLQLQNEDSLLHWHVDRLRGPQRANLGRKFYQWAVARYGSWPKALEAWQGVSAPGDAPAAGLLDFFEIVHVTGNDPGGGYGLRLADQARFWVDTMRAFNTAMVKFLRDDLRCQQLINTGNQKSADLVHLEDLERFANSAGDVLAVNRLVESLHYGRHTSFGVVEGDLFGNPSVLRNPRLFPLNVRQVSGYPMLITEGLWVPPMGYTTESAFLTATYQSVSGVDAYLWLDTSNEDEFAPPQSANGYVESQTKWSFNHPDVLGMFPAAAFVFRKGFIQQSDPVLVESRALDDMFGRKAPVLPEGELPRVGMNPLAFLTGPVEFVPGGRPGDTKQVNVRSLMDGGRVKSATGEVTFDAERGWCLFDTPKAQGVTAFFRRQGEFRLRDVTIEARHEYGAVFVVAIDEVPLRDSRRVLVQVGTRSRPEGWTETPEEIELEDGQKLPGAAVGSIGRAPWRVASADLTIEVRNPQLRRARALDANGYALADVPLTTIAGGVRFSFPEGTLYVVLE